MAAAISGLVYFTYEFGYVRMCKKTMSEDNVISHNTTAISPSEKTNEVSEPFILPKDEQEPSSKQAKSK